MLRGNQSARSKSEMGGTTHIQKGDLNDGKCETKRVHKFRVQE
jgi:hypothetical protein